MLSANTVLHIIEENGIEQLKKIIPIEAYQLIKKKYIDNVEQIPYLKKIIKKYETKQKKISKIEDKYEISI